MAKPPQPRKPNVLFFQLGNSYNSRSGAWSLYVDVVSGDVDLISQVVFFLPGNPFHVSRCPVPLKLSNSGLRVKRFSTPSCEKPIPDHPIKIKIVGQGGTGRKLKHTIVRKDENATHPQLFNEWRRLRPRRFVKMPDVDFGIELEMSCALGTPHETVAKHISKTAGIATKVVIHYSEVHDPFDGWKLVHDGSLLCSRSNPDCSIFELVSPILNGGQGARICSRVLRALKSVSAIDVNKSMGFHVHVSVDNFSLAAIKKICQNFIKFEDVIDTFMPPSRRTEAGNDFCKSNKDAVNSESNTGKHQVIASCKSLHDLCDLVNPTGRYYKLNLDNLKSGRQPTIEFRQHSGTSKYSKIASWVRFCLAFVYNSSRQPEPAAMKPNTSEEDQLDMLFEMVIEDRALKHLFLERRQQVRKEDATGDHLCSCHKDHDVMNLKPHGSTFCQSCRG
jgi:hypothetical protein